MPELTPSITDRDVPELDVPAAIAVLGGALVGAVGGYLMLTAAGNRLRQDLLRGSHDLFGGVNTLLATWDRLQRHGHLDPPARSANRPSQPRGTDT